jgi:hypothetical protein
MSTEAFKGNEPLILLCAGMPHSSCKVHPSMDNVCQALDIYAIAKGYCESA